MVLTSKTNAANLALGHLAYGNLITNVDTEQSSEAKQIRLFWDIALDTVLLAGNWPFAKAFMTLNLVEEAPNDRWSYAYRIPNDCLSVLAIFNEGNESPHLANLLPKHTIGSDSQGLLLYTSEPFAQMEYVQRKTTVAAWPSDFVLAFTYLLASLIAPSVTGGDQFKLGERAYAFYRSQISPMLAKSNNQINNQLPLRSGFISSRE